ncbi:MAG: GAF domain-containing protein [Anaerolineales bacterium]|nr:GAF domain-containing protein [Anaerolineales bacterium]
MEKVIHADEITQDSLQIDDLRALFEISRVILQPIDIAKAFKQIVRLARPVFIFDNAVLYQIKADGGLEPTDARAVGRGRSVEADMAWGEAIASEVIKSGQVILRSEQVGDRQGDRMRDRLADQRFLGLPLLVDHDLAGALIFVRFGGPDYDRKQIHLANLIAEQLTRLLERQLLIDRVADLEAERRLARLQQDFVATVTHDLRSPLGFIKGYATSLLRRDVEWDVETRREFLSIIDDEADRLTALIDNLLDSSRLQSGALRMDFQPVRLDTILRDLVARLQAVEFPNLVTLELEPQPYGKEVLADPVRLVQVFDNVLSNVAKYAPGSALVISLRWRPQRVEIVFHDFGPGIPGEHLENIFERFYRLPSHSSTVQGTGLGLFICKQIILAHQGEIYATSEVGCGTQIHIHLEVSEITPDELQPKDQES